MALALSTPPAFAASKDDTQTSRADFNKAMRKLWEDHVTWTRLYIVSAEGNLPDKDATTPASLTKPDGYRERSSRAATIKFA